MKKKKKELKDLTPEELQALMKSMGMSQESEEEEYIENHGNQNSPIYNFFQFFIGGPNRADTSNKQQGKPQQPPY